MYHGTDGMLFGMGWWWIIVLILFAAVIWAIVRPTKQKNNSVNHKTALDILNERYARGEIDKEEYETKKRDLGK